jgi:hypothetical protein
MPLPSPISGTTGIAEENRSSRPVSTNTCGLHVLICALERMERAALRGDSDIIINHV